MARTLLKLLLLGALSAGASQLPSALGGYGKLPGLNPGVAAAPGGSGESSAELRREMAGLGSAVSDLKALAAGTRRPEAPQGLSEEERGLMQDAAPQLKFRDNALTRTAGLAGGGAGLPAAAGALARLKAASPEFQTFTGFKADLLRFLAERQVQLAWALWLIPACAVVLSLLLFFCRLYTLSMLLSGLLFSLCSGALWALSAALGLAGLTGQQGLFAALPRELWLSPVVFLTASAGLLRFSDENHPFWNRTLSALSAPVAASLLAAAWPAALGWARGLLGGAAGGAS